MSKNKQRGIRSKKIEFNKHNKKSYVLRYYKSIYNNIKRCK